MEKILLSSTLSCFPFFFYIWEIKKSVFEKQQWEQDLQVGDKS